jgi:hypothetical protein
MKGKELREFLRVRCLLGVEKMGRIRAKDEVELLEAKDVNEVKEKKCGRRLQ